ncbi:MAG: hypothetical protein J0I99_04885 [Devosia sp.]|uniref:hypothetical protein n=1 Tax=Devosia sp. TaxID=1871048 RepID=UPI001AC3ADFB|nr:hypothetical protein [Devosia sp.]MBN9315051.1 hypothetical protein [Devosia sp.]
MSHPLKALSLAYYPAVTNHIADDPTPKDQAVYVPSVSPGFAMDVHAANWTRPLPNGISSNMLNFLDPANRDFFSISHVMSSAGQALRQPRPCIITDRDRSSTTLICDSGGYQIASGRMKITSDQDRLDILRWMELHADYAMTLDVPTGPVRRDPNYAFKSFRDCLTQTSDHLAFFERHRQTNAVELLNVLQGNDPNEADAWYDEVKKYAFEGWAFAGILRNDLYQLCRRVLIMANEGQIETKTWIHVLGTSDLETAVLLTALQRSINRHINPRLRISFDTSSPFRALAQKRAFTIPTFTSKEMSMPMRAVPDGAKFVGSDVRWPWPSPIGDRMTLSDFCVSRPPTAMSFHDKLSNHLLAHHNLAALCWGISLANRVFDSETVDHHHSIVPHVGAGVEAIDRVLASGSLATLATYKPTFAMLRHSDAYDTGDEHRE